MKPRPPLPPGPYLIVGLARSGIAAAQMLRARGERVIGVDSGAPPAARALAHEGVELHLQSDGLKLLADGCPGQSEHDAARQSGHGDGQRPDGIRTLVKSPGVPAQAPVVAAARAAGLTVLGELELAWRLLAKQFIAVTGTNGKTTTVHWIGHVHREAGLPVTLAGNVGEALSGLVGHLDPAATVVCETSSFQLEDTLAFAPEAAVLLNLSADHLDRHGTMAAYREAKLQIFAHQASGDLAVLGAGLHDVPTAAGVRRVRCGALSAMAGAADGANASTAAECVVYDGRLWWEGQPLLAIDELRLRGAHNLQNAMATAAVCLARGLHPDAVRAGLRSFAGVAHRLEEVARHDGVLYVNDSKATNVASTLVALESFAHADLAGASEASRTARVHLILGGQGKGQDFGPLRDPIAARCRAVYLIGEDAPLIAAALAEVTVPVNECGELEAAVLAAREVATPGDVVLLSPACASFDQFADYEARGERFKQILSR
ncbi:MAG TPA: UDP-N-acetylmuramoyl-L-alanine--D-glutamate ligase [Solirubrobacteraceae bacterium]